MTAQMVEVDLRKGEYIVCVYSRTGTGIWVLDGTPERLPQEATPVQLGTTVNDALDRSRSGLPELTRDSKPSQPLLDLLQVRDYATYAKGTRSVEVYRDGETVEVTPRRNEGGRNGFTPIEEEITTFSPVSAEQLGAEVAKAFTKATS